MIRRVNAGLQVLEGVSHQDILLTSAGGGEVHHAACGGRGPSASAAAKQPSGNQPQHDESAPGGAPHVRAAATAVAAAHDTVGAQVAMPVGEPSHVHWHIQ